MKKKFDDVYFWLILAVGVSRLAVGDIESALIAFAILELIEIRQAVNAKSEG